MPFQFRKEAIEEDLNTNFPSQGQGNPPLYYSLSEVVVPTYSINSATEGSNLPQNLQTAWDFSTGYTHTTNTTNALISTTGFWKVDLNYSGQVSTGTAGREASIYIDTGITTKKIWVLRPSQATNAYAAVENNEFIVFLRSGDTLRATTNDASLALDTWYRQIADVNGNLVNPLGFSFA